MTERFQRHHPPPDTHAQFCALLDAGRLVTTGGKRLFRRPCPRCRTPLLGSTDGAETCWCAFVCPACAADIGRTCRRPSEHGVFGAQTHRSRIDLARDDTERRAVHGDPDLPARWPPRPAVTTG